MNEVLTQQRTKSRFKKHETGYHGSAVYILSQWVGGIIEMPFVMDSSIVFVPDVVKMSNGVVQCLFEVVYSHPVNGKKLGMMQYYCYRNFTSLTVYEISADFILKQTEKPKELKFSECYTIDPWADEELIKHLLCDF